MPTRSSPRNRPGPPLETMTTATPAKQPVRKSPRFKETPTTPVTPMPMLQVRDKDDEPTFPMAEDPIRQPTQNPRINPETGLPWTAKAEKQAIKELLEKRTKRTREGDSSDSSSEEGTPRKQRRTSLDLVAKKRVGGGAKKKSRKGATVASMGKGKKILEKAVPSKSDSGQKHGGMLLGVSGQTLAGFSHGLKFYRTDEQGRVFDRYGKRIYQEGEEQTAEESSEEEEAELGVEELPENDSDDEDTLLKEIAEKQRGMAKQGKGEAILEWTPGVVREGGNEDGNNGNDDDGDDEQEEDDEDVSESKIQALQAKHKVAELCRQQELAERCRAEVLKIRQATEKGGRPPTPKRKTSKDLKTKKTSKTTQRGKKVIATKVPRAPVRVMPSTSEEVALVLRSYQPEKGHSHQRREDQPEVVVEEHPNR